MHTKNDFPLSLRLAPAKAGFALAGCLLALPASAFELELADGDVSGSLDSSLSYGAMWRVESRDANNIAPGDINVNDGNRNYNTGLVSQVFKLNSELGLNWGDYGLFVSGRAYYDTEVMDRTNDSGSLEVQPGGYGTGFSQGAKDYSGSRAEILDAYVSAYVDAGDMPLSIKFGNQVLSWGEGIFFREGVNTINALDQAAFNLPGSSVKDALLPAPMLHLNLGLTDSLSAETFYQFGWNKTRLNPIGTYFSTSDLFGAGSVGNTIWNESPASLAAAIDSYQGAGGAAGPLDAFLSHGLLSHREPTTGQAWLHAGTIATDEDAKDGGQFGLAMRYIAESLNDTEFSAYYVQYHSKTPIIAANLGTWDASQSQLITLAGGFGIPAAVGLGTLDVAGNINAFRHYAEKIDMWGASFSTVLGNTSVSGDLAFRPNNPIFAYHENDLLGMILATAVDPTFVGSGGLATSGDFLYGTGCANLNYPGATGQLDIIPLYCVGDTLKNQIKTQTVNWNLNAIHNFGPTLGLDGLFVIAEVAGEWLPELSGAQLDVLNSTAQTSGDNTIEANKLTRTAFGTTFMFRGQINDAFAGINLYPELTLSNDIRGNSHRAGNFHEGNNAVGLALGWSYLDSLAGALAYSTTEGSNSDRDNVAINVSYAF